MQTTVVSATDLRTNTRDILERAKFRGEHFVVESFRKPMVAIVGIQEYLDLMGQSEELVIERESERLAGEESERSAEAATSREESSEPPRQMISEWPPR